MSRESGVVGVVRVVSHSLTSGCVRLPPSGWCASTSLWVTVVESFSRGLVGRESCASEGDKGLQGRVMSEACEAIASPVCACLPPPRVDPRCASTTAWGGAPPPSSPPRAPSFRPAPSTSAAPPSPSTSPPTAAASSWASCWRCAPRGWWAHPTRAWPRPPREPLAPPPASAPAGSAWGAPAAPCPTSTGTTAARAAPWAPGPAPPVTLSGARCWWGAPARTPPGLPAPRALTVPVGRAGRGGAVRWGCPHSAPRATSTTGPWGRTTACAPLVIGAWSRTGPTVCRGWGQGRCVRFLLPTSSSRPASPWTARCVPVEAAGGVPPQAAVADSVDWLLRCCGCESCVGVGMGG